jgi:hypothetical protein
MEGQSDECWNKNEDQHEGHRSSGKNGPAQMSTCYVKWDVRIGKRTGRLKKDGQARSRE